MVINIQEYLLYCKKSYRLFVRGEHNVSLSVCRKDGIKCAVTAMASIGNMNGIYSRIVKDSVIKVQTTFHGLQISEPSKCLDID
jgi:hypothetical protein